MQRLRASKPLHGPFSSSKRRMRILGAIVEPTTGLLAISSRRELKTTSSFAEDAARLARARGAWRRTGDLVRTSPSCAGARLETKAIDIAKRDARRRRCQSNSDLSMRCSICPPAIAALRHKGAPLRQCGRASLLVELPADEMAFLIEMAPR